MNTGIEKIPRILTYLVLSFWALTTIDAADGVDCLSGGAEADVQILDLQNDLSRISHVVFPLCMMSAAVCAMQRVFVYRQKAIQQPEL